MIAPAYVNHGRWVVNCQCGAGVRIAPPEPNVRCRDCHTIITPEYPPDWKSGNVVLRNRPNPQNRNWIPSLEAAVTLGTDKAETVDDLARENHAHGLDSTPHMGRR